MKVKVKWDGHSQLVDLADRSVTDVTLGELRQTVASVFETEEEEFQLGLNKRDALQGDDQLLSEFGIVSGDLVHVIGANLPMEVAESRRLRPQPLGSHSSTVEDQTFVAASFDRSSSLSSTGSETVVSVSGSASLGSFQIESDSDVSLKASDMDFKEALDVEKNFLRAEVGQAEINRYLQEPLVLRESTASQVPISLAQLYKSGQCTAASDALWVAVHCLMLESGLVCKQSPACDAVMPNKWKNPGFYRCEYHYQVAPDVTCSCSINGVTLGSTVAIHGIAQVDSNYNTETVHLTASHYVRGLTDDAPTAYRSLDKLALLIKDKICLPLINELATSSGYRQGQGLLSLPYEVKLRILACLDAQSLCCLGRVCHDLCAVYKDKVIWRRLHLVYFGEPADSSLGQDWYELYKESFLTHKRREEEHRRHRQMMINMWPHQGLHLLPGHPPPPVPFHMIGGDYDLHPHFARGFTHHSVPGLPRVGLSQAMEDPVTALLGRNMMPGRPSQGRGNLTGSPFSSDSTRFI